MAREWSFCTLALGKNYCKLARQLAEDLARFAPDAELFVLSDSLSEFRQLPNVTALYHRQRSVLGYNDKVTVVRKALDRYRTALFIDTDSRILGPVELDPAILIRPGVKALRIRSWSYIYDTYDRSAAAPAWQKADLRIMSLLKNEYDIGPENSDIPYVVEFLFSVTRGSAAETDAFFRRWNELAVFCERSRFFRHEGYAMGLAAKLTGFAVEQHDFNGIHFFEPVKCRQEVANGTMMAEEYDSWNATINRYKRPRKHFTKRIPSWPAAIKWMRYLKTLTLGLDLISE